ncbi:hypothetical protein SDC9_166354 [bioreactor metagenome]|uniref:Uncharacterized protein n=1 Tax=bioreactor metagenome TaxID=1076179 RepID=A0A645FWS7_9ZZZZ
MKENKLPPLQKIIAFFFVLVFIASLFFIGYRIYTKPEYEAHEKEQASLLAVSALTLFAEKTANEPGIWTKFDNLETELMIDHMRIKGNWVVKVIFINKGSHIDVLSSVSSGWNSRSPQSAEVRAKISGNGNLEFKDEKAAPAIAARIKSGRMRALGKVHSFRFPDEQKKVPALIEAEEYLLTDQEGNEFLILKDPLKISQGVIPIE